MAEVQKKRFGWLKIIGIIVVLLAAAIIAIPFLVDANQFRPRLEAEIGGALGRQVTVGNLKLSLFSGSVAADDIVIADDPAFSKSPFVKAQSLKVGVEVKPLILSRTVHITGITLERPEVTLIRSASGIWNFSSIGSKSEAKPAAKPGSPSDAQVSVSRFEIKDGRLTVVRGGGRTKPRIYDKVNLRASDLSFDAAFPFNLTATLPGGGNVSLEGKTGPMNRTDATLTPLSATLALSRLDLLASGFIEPDSGLAGIIDFNGDLTSDGKLMKSKGHARADKLQFVKGGAPASQAVSLDYALDYHPHNQSGTLSETKVQFGKAVARLNGIYETHGESTVLKMKLRGENMPAEDLEALLPAIGVTLPKGASIQGGTLNADLTAEGPTEKVVTTGTIGILKTRLAGFDLGSKMTAVASLAGIKSDSGTEIEKLASDVRVAPDGIQAKSLLLVVPALGELSGAGTVGSNNSLDFKMLARLRPSGGIVGGLARIAGSGADKGMDVPFSIRGTTSNPVFVPDAKGVAGSLLKSVISGKGSKTGDGGQSQKLGDTLRGLFKKKN